MLKTEYLNALDDMVEVLRENSLLSDSFAKDIEEKKHKLLISKDEYYLLVHLVLARVL